MYEQFTLSHNVGPHHYHCQEWGGRLESHIKWVGFDCETELIDFDDPTHIPELALLTHYDDSGNSMFVHPDHLADWVFTMKGKHLVGHNVAFDFWVIAEHLSGQQEHYALSQWWTYAREGMFHDTVILDRLVALADSDEHPGNMQSLDKLAKKYLDITLDKSDPYRSRFSELIGYPTDTWYGFDSGFFKYAITDSIVTLRIHQILRSMAKEYKPQLCEILPDAEEKWGQLTETLQVRGAIALAQISRTGIQVDLDQVGPVRVEIHNVINEQARILEKLGSKYSNSGVFKYNRHGEFIRTDAGVQRKNAKVVKEILNKIAMEEDIFPPENKDDLVTDSVKFWEQYANVHPFIMAYTTWAAQSKLAQFLVNLKDERIYPRYTPLVRTGRASCWGPNLQQLPRRADFREMIVPAKDHWLLSIDYGTLELRTLAQTCLTRFGKSSLADVFKAGGDPHIYTAGMILNLSPEEFRELPTEEQKKHRQQAKAINFGVPGGLGARALQAYAKASYGVEMDEQEATRLRNKLINSVYPELKRHLRERKYRIIARNMYISTDTVREVFDDYRLFDYVAQILGGTDLYGNSDAEKKWTPDQQAMAWNEITALNQNPKLMPLLATRETNPKLARLILFGNSSTLSGRVRGHVRFAARCNTPFQGLAADGAKLAMFELLRKGYRVVGFVHDEVMIEIPKNCDIDAVYQDVDKIMCGAMDDLCPDIPIICEGLVADCWGKEDQKYDCDGRIVPYIHTRKLLPKNYVEKELEKQLKLW